MSGSGPSRWLGGDVERGFRGLSDVGVGWKGDWGFRMKGSGWGAWRWPFI